MDRGSSVGVEARKWTRRPRNFGLIPGTGSIFMKRSDRLLDQLSFLVSKYRLLSLRRKGSGGVRLIGTSHLAPRLRTGGAIPPGYHIAS
jgi:hypothetical protein